MSYLSEFKNGFAELLKRVSLREVISLIGAGILGALVSILVVLNREEMAETGQWLPVENGVLLLVIWITLFTLMMLSLIHI